MQRPTNQLLVEIIGYDYSLFRIIPTPFNDQRWIERRRYVLRDIVPYLDMVEFPFSVSKGLMWQYFKLSVYERMLNEMA